MKLDNIGIVYNRKYEDEANIIRELCSVINKQRGIIGNNHCIRIYIDKSVTRFVFRTLPLYKKLLLCFSFPFWYIKNKKTKELAAIKYQRKNWQFLLLKPMDVYETISSPTGDLIFSGNRNNKSIKEVFTRNACTSLVDLLLKHINLPHWLNIGFVVVCGEVILNRPFVKNDSIKLLDNVTYARLSTSSLARRDEKQVSYNLSKGYWTVKYLEEQHPGFLKETFKGCKGEEIVTKIREKLGLDMEDDEKYWIQLDELLVNHYQDKLKN